jgi:hypothetical protein
MVLSIMKFPILPNPDFTQDTILPTGNIKNILELVLLHILTTVLMRSWNVANNQQYIKIEFKSLAKEEEFLSKDQFNEMIMIGLRTIWGVDLGSLKEKFNDNILNIFKMKLKQNWKKEFNH